MREECAAIRVNLLCNRHTWGTETLINVTELTKDLQIASFSADIQRNPVKAGHGDQEAWDGMSRYLQEHPGFRIP